MNDRQRKFVDAYIDCGNGAEAYRRAGYVCNHPDSAANGADRLMGNNEVLQAIEEGRKRLQKATEMNQQWVMERLRENLERSMQAVPVLDSLGRPTGVYAYRGAVANRAAELIGKQLGMFRERFVGNIDVTITALPTAARIADESRFAEDLDALPSFEAPSARTNGRGPKSNGQAHPH